MTKVGIGDHSNGHPANHDPNFKGPMKERSCTDMSCCFLFVLFLIGWLIIAIIAFSNSNVNHLINPTDSQGRICGINKPGAYDHSSKPFLYFFDLRKCLSYKTFFGECNTPQVCVKECPSYYFTFLQLQTLMKNMKRNEFKIIIDKNVVCINDKIKSTIENFDDMKKMVENDKCSAYVVATAPIMRWCIPKLALNAKKAVSEGIDFTMDNLTRWFGNEHGKIPNNAQIEKTMKIIEKILVAKGYVENVFSDLSISWWQISFLLGSASIVAFSWIVIMQILGGLMVWLSIYTVIVFSIAGSTFCWYKYLTIKQYEKKNEFTNEMEKYATHPDAFFYTGIGLSVLLVIMLIIFMFIRSRIRIAIALIKESSKAMRSMLSTLFFPIFPFLLHMGLFIIWASIAIWLASWGEENCRIMEKSSLRIREQLGNGTKCDCSKLDNDNDNEDPPCVFVNYTMGEYHLLPYMQAYNLFAYFWLACFVCGLADSALAGAFASHYWAFKKPQDVPAFPVIIALYRTLRYHIGSIAFGSLLLAIVKFVQIILKYLDDKLSLAENKIAKFILQCIKFAVCCMDKILRFLTRNAYIMMAIYGKDFCTSARESFFLMARNVVRYVVLDKIAGILLFFGKFAITIGMGLVAFIYFCGFWTPHEFVAIDLNYCIAPVIIVVIGTYLICDAFFDVYEMAVDTTFFCFCEDNERNDGSFEKPYFMSKELLDILGKENVFNLAKK